MIVTGTLREMLSAVATAERLAVRGLEEGTIESEPSLTDRFLGAMDEAIGKDGLQLRGYRMRVRTLLDRGPGAPEREFGADLVGVFSLDTPECTLRKGFLVQAKLAGSVDVSAHPARGVCGFQRVSIRRSNREEKPSDLSAQCRRMLRVTPASYVFVYSPQGIAVVSANTVANLEAGRQSHEVYIMTVRDFFREFFKSFIGDYRISAHDDASLRAVRNDTHSKAAMQVSLRAEV